MDSVERWLPVIGWEGFYEVSDWGRVRSCDRFSPHSLSKTGWTLRKGKIMNPSRDKDGYLVVTLNALGVKRQRPVHQLVLEAFDRSRPKGMQVRHYPDPDPTNCRLENLSWGTPSENTADQVEHGTHHTKRRTECPAGHAYTPENTYVHGNGWRRCRTCDRDREARRLSGWERQRRAHE